ncbi:hypothetical protein ACJX0J_014108, partial [Zea mays]
MRGSVILALLAAAASSFFGAVTAASEGRPTVAVEVDPSWRFPSRRLWDAKAAGHLPRPQPHCRLGRPGGVQLHGCLLRAAPLRPRPPQRARGRRGRPQPWRHRGLPPAGARPPPRPRPAPPQLQPLLRRPPPRASPPPPPPRARPQQQLLRRPILGRRPRPPDAALPGRPLQRLRGDEGTVLPRLFDRPLDAIFLNHNRLRFQLPDNFGNSPTSVVVLTHNAFGGCLPASVATMSGTLKEILLINNGLSSCFPPEIGLLRELTVLDVSFNQLAGLLPPELALMRKLEQLDVAHNLLTGAVPPGICDLPRLKNFMLAYNFFTCEPPSCARIVARDGDRSNCLPNRSSQRTPQQCAAFYARPLVNCAAFQCKPFDLVVSLSRQGMAE